MAHSYNIEEFTGTAYCRAGACSQPARFIASYVYPNHKGESEQRTPYCMAHGLIYARKHSLKVVKPVTTEKECRECGVRFTGNADQNFCSTACSRKAYQRQYYVDVLKQKRGAGRG